MRKLPFLEGLAQSEISAVLAAAHQRRFLLANSFVTSQGEEATNIFIALRGRARSFFLADGGQKVYLHWYPPGEMFGPGIVTLGVAYEHGSREE